MATEANIHYGNTKLEVKKKVVTLDTSVIGSNFSPTSRMVGNMGTLFGVDASKVVNVYVQNAALNPAALLLTGFYNGNFYLATTQNTTLSGTADFYIFYTD